MTPPFLERIKIVGFGAFSGKVVGPFTPRLNVVFGRNEAGKTTLAFRPFCAASSTSWPMPVERLRESTG